MLPTNSKIVIYMGSDHAGYSVKPELNAFLKEKGFAVTDLGTFSEEPYDYPDIAREVAEKVLERLGSFGVVLCGSGIGVDIAANRIRGIRCANVRDMQMAEMARRHNDCNMIALGARDLTVSQMKDFLDKFLSTDFESDQERHVRRVKKLDMI
jgi:ribose 5-phosphate isomerase B